MILDKTLDKMELIFNHPPPSFRKKLTDTISEHESSIMPSKLNTRRSNSVLKSHRSERKEMNKIQNFLNLSQYERDELVSRFKSIQENQIGRFREVKSPISFESRNSKTVLGGDSRKETEL